MCSDSSPHFIHSYIIKIDKTDNPPQFENKKKISKIETHVETHEFPIGTSWAEIYRIK